MHFPDPLNPKINRSRLKPKKYSRAGNSYLFSSDKMIVLKSGGRYNIDFSKIGDRTQISTDSARNQHLDSYVLDSEYYRLLQQGVSLSHFSTFSDGRNAYVLTGPPNTGKTGINLALNLKGFKFMADEDAPINESGEALPLPMPLSIGNNNIDEFQTFLNDLGVNYSKSKTKIFNIIKNLPIPLVDKALDRLVAPIKIDPKEMSFETGKKEIKTAFYIQPENRDNIELETMKPSDFCRKMVLWNEMQRSNFERMYKIWKTEFEDSNDFIEKSSNKDRDILEKCFENVKIKKLRVPLQRQPRKIAATIEDEI